MERLIQAIVWLLGMPIYGVWRLLGWRVEGCLPDEDRFIAIGWPHTSSWDTFILIAVAIYLHKRPYALMKSELRKYPVIGRLMMWGGGIPVERSVHSNAVDQVAAFFKTHRNAILVMSPEGTRKKTSYWRSGFYYMAQAAGVPIVMGALDYRHKRVHLGDVLVPSGNIAADMDLIRAFYTRVGAKGKFPEQAGDIRLRAEVEPDHHPEAPA